MYVLLLIHTSTNLACGTKYFVIIPQNKVFANRLAAGSSQNVALLHVILQSTFLKSSTHHFYPILLLPNNRARTLCHYLHVLQNPSLKYPQNASSSGGRQEKDHEFASDPSCLYFFSPQSQVIYLHPINLSVSSSYLHL